jgi:hypothetical protein
LIIYLCAGTHVFFRVPSTDLFGQTGKNNCVPVGITANATKAIVQNGVPFSFSYAPQVMLRGHLNKRISTGDLRGNPLYAVREFANSNTTTSTFLYDFDATTIGLLLHRMFGGVMMTLRVQWHFQNGFFSDIRSAKFVAFSELLVFV